VGGERERRERVIPLRADSEIFLFLLSVFFDFRTNESETRETHKRDEKGAKDDTKSEREIETEKKNGLLSSLLNPFCSFLFHTLTFSLRSFSTIETLALCFCLPSDRCVCGV
jgi:hypothetical protein